jgi:hypothetical protein
VEVWLTCHQHDTGKQWAILYDPIHKHTERAIRRERLDTRSDWKDIKDLPLNIIKRLVFGDE